MQIGSPVAASEIPPSHGGGKEPNEETVAIIAAMAGLPDGQALPIEFDSQELASRRASSFKKLQGYKATVRGNTLYVSRNGTG